MKAIYGLLGYPLGHSFSKMYFNEKFQSENILAEYRNFEIEDISLIREVVLTEPNLCGLNVTIPYKESVIKYLDDLDEKAERIGAVNVIKFIRQKNRIRLVGYNSDVVGFKKSIEPLLPIGCADALILGTGGASKAVYCALEDLGIHPVYVSRMPSKGQLSYPDLDKFIMERYKIIVNTTPLGMYPNVEFCPHIPYDLIAPGTLAYDVIYNPEETLFRKKAKARGAVVKNGLEMLLLQADEAWRIWNL